MAPDEDIRWLDDEERAAWLNIVRIVVKLPTVLDAQLGRDAGVSYFEYMVLAMLSERRSRTLRASDLARVVNSSATRLSNVVRRLEQRGLLARLPDPDDGRGTLVRLTDAGLDLTISAAPLHVQTVRAAVFDPLEPGDVQALHASLGRILARIDPDSATEPLPIEVEPTHERAQPTA
ncbi:MarR family winged helix-turn-helix transcriptional regulator [Allobranchiibius huperziae]|uniref:DNA-binding MarR family transcriptional regulator n=1 Tax=Allobranchiibius huperziae TaxID=1874116 RepID=A0A853DJF9_9MICO|nr:winged helix DNA-binding protein [Allobranchiibius huperziae]NYJ76089.1 DNA-binding MarR family transcriptional regulator [Allobranchiibius huperziae]